MLNDRPPRRSCYRRRAMREGWHRLIAALRWPPMIGFLQFWRRRRLYRHDAAPFTAARLFAIGLRTILRYAILASHDNVALDDVIFAWHYSALVSLAVWLLWFRHGRRPFWDCFSLPAFQDY